MSYEIPFGEKRICYSPKVFYGNRHYLYARAARQDEIGAYRNLALNVCDSQGKKQGDRIKIPILSPVSRKPLTLSAPPVHTPLSGSTPETTATGKQAAAGSIWNADLGNGNYRNPILYADYSDPDAIRVGDDYFMVANGQGSIQPAPGLMFTGFDHFPKGSVAVLM